MSEEPTVNPIEAALWAANERIRELEAKLAPKVVQAADLYHESRAVAVAAAERLQSQDSAIGGYSVQLEPDNGWVIQLYPGRADLSAYRGVAEIMDGSNRLPVEGKVRRVGSGTGATKREPGQGKGSAPGGQGGPSSAPSKGATAKVWEIADRVGPDRKAIIDACIAEGINQATAATQYSKWKKARGG